MFTLAFLDPGHFHAALTLRERHPLLREEVFVYARPGAELDAFLALVRAFNGRAQAPTAWQPRVVTGEDPLARLLADHAAGTARVDAVVLAGRNDRKLPHLARLHGAGLPVLADKPWIRAPDGLPHLEAATDGRGALVMDIMTQRHELCARLQRRLVAEPEVFGEWLHEPQHAASTRGAPALYVESVHTLFKSVNGVPLVRPQWYFDVAVQGDGMVDITTHLADLALWLLRGSPYDYARDVTLEAARRWDTPIPLQRYRQITGAAAFPPELDAAVQGGVLQLACNGEIDCRVRGLPVRLHSVWVLDAPPGGSDTQTLVLRGTRAEIREAWPAEHGFQPQLSVHPRPGQAGVRAALERAVAAWQDDLPGLAVAPGADGALALRWPAALRSTHEQHFARVLERFLRLLEAGRWPAEIAADLRCKYTLLARAQERAAAAQGEG